MAGRGFLKDVPPICDERIKMLRNGRWQIMTEPINFDRPFAGVGLAASFASAWCDKHEDEEIGLIPCAEGGTSLDDWAVGGALFDHAVFQAKLAMRCGSLDGILWHQGENDCSPEGSKLYCGKFAKIVEAFRRELGAPDIPLIIGGLGDYLTEGRYGKYFADYILVNQALQDFAAGCDNCWFVSAAGLTANQDGIHLNAESLRKFGLRYFEALDSHRDVLGSIGDEDGAIMRLYEKPLSKTALITLLECEFVRGDITLEDYDERMSGINGQA